MTARRFQHQTPLWEMPPLAARRFRGQWRDEAACFGHPTLPAHTWDDTAPGEGAGHIAAREARIHRAKNVCRTCPVKAECATDVDLDYDEGVRGGEDLRDVRAAARRAREAG